MISFWRFIASFRVSCADGLLIGGIEALSSNSSGDNTGSGITASADLPSFVSFSFYTVSAAEILTLALGT
jgi:hypothetical protein